MTDLWLGIDPGKSGAIAAMTVGPDGAGNTDVIGLNETEMDVFEWLRTMHARTWTGGNCFALLEKVNTWPGQSGQARFKLGQSYGFCRGLLTALQIPWDTVTPVKWQRALKCLSGGDKRVTKAAAQRLYPKAKVTHRNADALLLAELARRRWSEGR